MQQSNIPSVRIINAHTSQDGIGCQRIRINDSTTRRQFEAAVAFQLRLDTYRSWYIVSYDDQGNNPYILLTDYDVQQLQDKQPVTVYYQTNFQPQTATKRVRQIAHRKAVATRQCKQVSSEDDCSHMFFVICCLFNDKHVYTS